METLQDRVMVTMES